MSEHSHPQTGQPVDDRAALRPGPVTLAGNSGRVEKLDASHATSLWDAVKDHDAIWTYMGYGPFTDAPSFAAWVSARAALRYGFTFERILRQHIIAKGRSRDTAWFSMLDSEWPARKRNFERWLSPENFTADGKQKLSLSALNGVAE